MTTTTPLPPLVSYYGSLIDEVGRADDYVTSLIMAEQVIPTLVRTTPVVAVRPGEYLGDYHVMVPVPWVLPESFGDDEYTFECE